VPDKIAVQQKHVYIAAFLLGIGFMFLIYIIFGLTSPGEYGAAVQGNVEVNVQGQQIPQVDIDGISVPIVHVSNTKDETQTSPAFLGIEIMAVDAVMAEQLNVSGKNGVLVNSVVQGSPAQKAGLERGDVIVSLDKNAVKDIDGFREIMTGLAPGDNVRIVYIRDGKRGSTYAKLIAASPILS